MKRGLIYSFLSICLLIGCVDPIRLNTADTAGVLVVDGLVTNETGAYTVKLSRSITFDNSRPLRVFAVPEPGAVVSISDGEQTEQLIEKEPGVYVTATTQGVIGASYSVNIRTKDGKTFHSNPQKMLPVSPVDSIQYEYTIYDRFFINKNNVPKTEKAQGFNIYVYGTDPKGFGNNYRWEVEGIYEFFSVTDNPETKQCWVTLPRLESTLQLSADALFDGGKFRQWLCVILYERPTRYMVKIRQSSLTEEAYAFWKNSQGQQTSSGSVFDPPPTVVVGNVVGDNGETTLGYFTVSALSRKNFLFNRFEASGFMTPSPKIIPQPGDCRNHVPGATNMRPEGF